MTGRLLILHLRARRAPAAGAGLAVIALFAWQAGDAMMDRPHFSSEQARIPVAALATLLAAGVLAQTLGGADEWLERSTPRPTWRWRAVHLSVLSLAGGLALGITGLRQPDQFGAYNLVRGLVGLLALTAIAAAAVGVQPSWIPVLAYAGTVYLAAPRHPGGPAAVWAWPMQPWSVPIAAITAALLSLLAITLHAAVGVRPSSDETA